VGIAMGRSDTAIEVAIALMNDKLSLSVSDSSQ
jgi:hypothetical protein